jgi:hypothetical protein
LNQQIIFILDTFNEATEELAHWLEGQFLMEIATNQKFIALIAGQHIPKPNIEWSYCCESQKLAPIDDHQAWYTYATEEQLPFDLKEIGVIVDCLQGIPAVVIGALEAGRLKRQKP